MMYKILASISRSIVGDQTVRLGMYFHVVFSTRFIFRFSSIILISSCSIDLNKTIRIAVVYSCVRIVSIAICPTKVFLLDFTRRQTPPIIYNFCLFSYMLLILRKLAKVEGAYVRKNLLKDLFWRRDPLPQISCDTDVVRYHCYCWRVIFRAKTHQKPTSRKIQTGTCYSKE